MHGQAIITIVSSNVHKHAISNECYIDQPILLIYHRYVLVVTICKSMSVGLTFKVRGGKRMSNNRVTRRQFLTTQ